MEGGISLEHVSDENAKTIFEAGEERIKRGEEASDEAASWRLESAKTARLSCICVWVGGGATNQPPSQFPQRLNDQRSVSGKSRDSVWVRGMTHHHNRLSIREGGCNPLVHNFAMHHAHGEGIDGDGGECGGGRWRR